MPTLVLLRHGESTWNAENRFTGWVDVDLTEKGEEEAAAAGQLLLAEREQSGLDFAVVHTSVLTRAVRTADIALSVMGRAYLPVRRHWRLNERHYGALQGLNKAETAARHGEEQVALWRRSYDVAPPLLGFEDEAHPRFDPRYGGVAPAALPGAECLADVVVRLVPYFEDAIAGDLLGGRDVLVVAHGNSLRALYKYLEAIPDEEIAGLNIPTGVPRIYRLDHRLALAEEPRYLGDEEEIAARARAIAPGGNTAFTTP
jgi:2,3-bisphosphoglycerate-dependent phosphoglycerate mutase